MKKNLFKFLGIVALVAIIGFGIIACGGGGGDEPIDPSNPAAPTAGTYTGKDVLGNTYTLSLAAGASSSVSSRSAARAIGSGDTYTMTVKGRDGKTRTVKAGKVSGVNADGTVSLKPEGAATAFTATVGDSALKTVVAGTDASGNIASLPITGDENRTTLTPRTFSEIYLRAIRWTNAPYSGEHYGTATSVLVKDFPTRVSKLTPGTSDQYRIKIQGKSDTALSKVKVEIQGLTDSDQWVWLGQSNDYFSVDAGTPFTKAIDVMIGSDASSYDLKDYKEIILQVTNVMWMHNSSNSGENQDYGTIPADVPDGQIGATITDFNIVLVDKDSEWDAVNSNVEEYTYGFKEDGLSVAYQQAVFHLSSENIAKAKQAGAKFKFKMSYISSIETFKPAIDFIWQGPAQGKWWQDQKAICGSVKTPPDSNNWVFQYGTGATWDAGTKTMTINLSDFITDADFASATEVNFIIGYWYGGGANAEDIGDLLINYAEITTP